MEDRRPKTSMDASYDNKRGKDRRENHLATQSEVKFPTISGVESLNNAPFPELKTKLSLYNTMGRTQELFRPLDPPYVSLYCCGPTVYNFQHIGNLRTYIFEDVLSRSLTSAGYKVNHVMNTTDVGHLVSDADLGEDKMLVASRREGKKSADIAAFYTEQFFRDCEKLNIQLPTTVCAATQHIPQMIKLIERLLDRGVAYESAGNVYFDVSKFPEYGRLAGARLEDLLAGARIEPDPNKRSPYDFALWFTRSKFEGQELQWDSPWGVGYPGWHIECSAMALQYLGETVDIHCGGTDHVGVHHTNEIAQVEAATGNTWVQTWLHGAFLVDQEGKMSKSKGKFLTIQTVEEQGISPLAYRYFCLGAHYRRQLSFSWDALRGAATSLERLQRGVRELKADKLVGMDPSRHEGVIHHRDAFVSAVANDLNMPQALAATWGALGDLSIPESVRRWLLADFDKILGLSLCSESSTVVVPEDVLSLAAAREDARRERDFVSADKFRREIESRGYMIEDSKHGVPLIRPLNKRKNSSES